MPHGVDDLPCHTGFFSCVDALLGISAALTTWELWASIGIGVQVIFPPEMTDNLGLVKI